ncbi:PD-(D/E)XK nuclease-like domain-containing protein [Serratia fonticola]|uniref:PD-(D/E)XK nuclease-like domain-containing protein n=1 Tax=Serratia fonticola TaxID=47917 RepID=UPI00301D64C6
MKYFRIKLLTTVDHPNGKFARETYLAAENKTQAKTKASTYIFENDGRNCMFYKAPRLEEVSEELYLEKTMGAEELFPHHAEMDRYLACLVLFGVQEAYDESEQQDALEFLANPDDEPEKFAEFNVLCEHLADVKLEQGVTLEAVKAAALSLYNGQWPSAELSPVAVDNAVHNGVGAVVESESVGDGGPLVNNSSVNDDRASQSVLHVTDWKGIERAIACALWMGDVDPADVHPSVMSWADKKIARRDEDVMAWGLALRKVPDADIARFDLRFVFDLVRERPDFDACRDVVALDAYVSEYVRQFATMYPKVPGGDAVVDACVDETPTDAPPVIEHAEVDTVAEAVVTEPVPFSAPAILETFPPVNGAVESGADMTVELLNARLASLLPGCSLVLAGLPNAVYHAADGYSSTQLRLVQTSGTSALDWYRAAPRDEDTEALSIGAAVHTALLEPDRFAVEYACAPVVNLRTNAGKEALAAFEERCSQAGITPMKAEEHRKVCLMRDSARAQPIVSALLQHGVAELSVFFRTDRGTLFKIRPDWFGQLTSVPFVLDVKTTDDVHVFGKSVEAYGYHVQAAFYSWVMHMAFGIEVDFAFSALSKSRECSRYPVALGLLDDEDFDEGMWQALDLVAQIEQGGQDGFAVDMGTFHRPWWAKRADRQRRERAAFGGEA